MTFSFRLSMFALAVLPCALLWAAEPDKAAKPDPAPAADAAAAPATNAVPAEAASEDGAPAAEGEKPAARDSADFERYKTIVDRKPFGKEPPNFNPDAPAGSAAAAAAADMAGEEGVNVSEEEQRIISSVRVSVLNVTPRGKAAVGFTDSSKSPAVNYYLLEGESRDGWTFVSADVPEKTVVLSQNGVEATIPLGGSTPEAGGKKGRPGGTATLGRPAAAAAPLLGRRGPQAAAPAEPPPGEGGAFAHLRARRARKEADQKAEAEAAAAAAEQAKADREAAAAEREQQRAALLQIQEELRRQREERQNRAAEAEDAGQQQDQGGGQPVQE